MAVRDIVLLGDPRLHESCEPVVFEELSELGPQIVDLGDTLLDFRQRWGAGRAIAAPQIGWMKRVVYMHLPHQEPVVFLNPSLEDPSPELIELWDDCMSFPELLVRVRRHRSCVVRYRDLEWQEQRMPLEDDLSELLQHEIDHLDGILATSRAIDGRSFALRRASSPTQGPAKPAR